MYEGLVFGSETGASVLHWDCIYNRISLSIRSIFTHFFPMDSKAVSRSGNLQRAEWRRKCRQILTDHLSITHLSGRVDPIPDYVIGSKLGINIEPEHVRLMPRDRDVYIWASLPEKEHLFNKQLSKHSVGAYVELCRGVGVSFEAVAKPALTIGIVEYNRKVENISSTKAFLSDINFTLKITAL